MGIYIYFHQLGPLGRVGLVVAVSVRLKFCYLNLFKPCEIFLTKLNNVVILDDVKVMKQLL